MWPDYRLKKTSNLEPNIIQYNTAEQGHCTLTGLESNLGYAQWLRNVHKILGRKYTDNIELSYLK